MSMKTLSSGCSDAQLGNIAKIVSLLFTNILKPTVHIRKNRRKILLIGPKLEKKSSSSHILCSMGHIIDEKNVERAISKFVFSYFHKLSLLWLLLRENLQKNISLEDPKKYSAHTA